jgi:glycosyltransferase involved in cell wall biosynthesis
MADHRRTDASRAVDGDAAGGRVPWQAPGAQGGGSEVAPIRVRHLISSCMRNHGPSGGIIAQLRHEDRALFDSSVWSMYPPPPGRSADSAVREAGAGVHAFGMASSFFDLRVLRPLVRRLREERPHVLHCHLVRANLYGRIAARAAGVPVVISTLRNVEDYFVAKDLGTRLIRAVERRTAPLVSRYVAVSEGVRTAAIRYLGIPQDQIVTVLNAVDLAPLRDAGKRRGQARELLGAAPDRPVLASVGSLDARKNHAMLLRLVAELTRRGRDVTAVIIGDGPERDALETLSRDLGLERRVCFLGFRADAATLVAGADLFVMTSYAEGLPRAIMEAMASGVPCVVSSAGGNAEAVVHGESGYVHDVADFDGFVDSIARLLADDRLRARFGEAARERAFAVFTPDRAAAEYAALYRSLLSTRPGRPIVNPTWNR